MLHTKKKYKIKRIFSLKIPKNSNIGIWIPISRGSDKYNSNIVVSDIYENENTKVLFWEFKKRDKNRMEKLVLEQVINARVNSPQIEEDYLRRCTRLDEDLTSSNKQILELAKELTANIQNNSKKVEVVTNYLVNNLEYEYPPKQREATKVFDSKKSDCGGYHALLVSILRSLNIPSIMDFGAKLPAFSPHVWSWWFNNETERWNMVDLNDIQNNIVNVDRVSYSLGTNPIIENFPIKILFIQNYLAWDYNYDFNKTRGTFLEIENINKATIL
jgi:hypothetical protein